MGRAFAVAVAGVLSASALGAVPDPVAVGPEFQVNSYTAESQVGPAVSLDANGDFVVVWSSFGSSGTDSSDYSIQGQRYAAGGAPLGGQFQINTFTTGGQYNADVSLDVDGDFVVVWDSLGSSAGDTSSLSVQGQRFASGGAVEGDQFEVNSYTTSDQYRPAISLDADGDFVVVWASEGSSASDASSFSIQGQRFDTDGVQLGGEFQVNSYTTGLQYAPKVSLNADGDFVVVWASYGSAGSDTSGYSIQGQLFGAAGGTQGGEIQVNSLTTNAQILPDVAANAGGDFVAVWMSAVSGGSDTSSYSIQGQRYTAGGGPEGAQFQVNTYTPDYQGAPAVSMDADGDFVVVWHSAGSAGSDSSSFGIQGQRFAADGTSLGGQFQVNSYTTSEQSFPSVALDPDGDFVVAWTSYGSAGTDSSAYSIQGQRFRVTGNLAGRVFFDQDFDGVQGDLEPGLAGVTVELYDDQLALRRTAVTDASGEYLLRPKEGSWHIRVVPPATQSITVRDAGIDDAADSDVDPASGESDPFEAQINVSATRLDAGLTHGIGDRVWNDLDHDGLREGGEPGIAGVRVRLRAEAGAEVLSTFSDFAGVYHFNDMSPASYYVEFEAPAGFAFSPADQGADDTADSDADQATGASTVFAFELAEIDTSVDAGVHQLPYIAGRVWDDRDQDGVRETGEPGIGNLLVRLLDGTGTTVLASQATEAGGFYAFEGLASATYLVEVVPLALLELSPPDAGGDDAIDSDFNPATARTAAIAFSAGSVVANVDAGLRVAVVFRDGFESGGFARWSDVAP